MSVLAVSVNVASPVAVPYAPVPPSTANSEAPSPRGSRLETRGRDGENDLPKILRGRVSQYPLQRSLEFSAVVVPKLARFGRSLRNPAGGIDTALMRADGGEGWMPSLWKIFASRRQRVS
jgi:hypothetical protein